MPPLSSSVVIATRNRVEPLRECLKSISRQTRLPSEVVLVDASDDHLTAVLARAVEGGFACPLRYLRARARSLVVQRWQGAAEARGDVIIFVDDDVILEPDYIFEVARVFEEDTAGDVGGVGGTVNGGFVPPSRLNSFLLRVFVGREAGGYAGRVVGPAVNFFHASRPGAVEDVEWLSGAAMAYRRDVLLAERCWESFSGYSFMEDVHLSARVGRKYRLLNTSRARLLHKEMGKTSQTDWEALGESMVLNRHAIAMHVLQRRRLLDYARLLGYEFLYCTIAQTKNHTLPWPVYVSLLRGKLRGVGRLLRGRSPHRPYFSQGAAAGHPARVQCPR